MKLGVIVSPGAGWSYAQICDLARGAEKSGFGSFWVSDHFFGGPGGTPDRNCLEAWTLLAALARRPRDVSRKALPDRRRGVCAEADPAAASTDLDRRIGATRHAPGRALRRRVRPRQARRRRRRPDSRGDGRFIPRARDDRANGKAGGTAPAVALVREHPRG